MIHFTELTGGIMAHRLVFLLACLFSVPAVIFAQDGASLYRRHCAMCHEAGAQTRAPSRDALRQLAPESEYQLQNARIEFEDGAKII